MRGKPVGEQLEKVRAVTCARSGLKLVHDETPGEEEIDRLYAVYTSGPDDFVIHMTNRIDELRESVLANEDPADAIEMCMVAGLLADRLTNRQMLEENAWCRKRNGVASANGFVYSDAEVTPYHGKDVGK